MWRRHRRVWFGLAAVGLLLLQIACGGGEDGTAGGSSTSGQGSLQGFAFTPLGRQGLEVRLGRTSTPPDGFGPAAGAGVAVGNVTITTAADGSFTLTDVPIGSQSLIITVGGQSVTFPVTIVANATIEVGEPVISRQVALQAILDAAAGAGFTPEQCLVVMPSTPLPAGVTVGPALPVEEDSPRQAELTVTLAASSWLGYVDPFSTSLFGHAVLHVLVDDQTGAVTTLARQSWPLLNGFEYYRDRDALLDTADVARLPQAEPGGFQAVERHSTLGSDLAAARLVDGCTSGRLFVYTMAGYNESGVRDSADVFGLSLQQITNGGSGAFQGPSADPVADIQAGLRALYAQMQPCDSFVLYLVTHAATPNFYRMNLQTNDSITAIFPRQFLLNECPACHITVVQEVCYAGSNITRTGPAGNPTFKQIIDGLTGKDVLYLMATNNRIGAKCYDRNVVRSILQPFGIVRNTGGAFTRALEGALDSLVDDYDGNLTPLMATAFQRSLQDSDVAGQDAQVYFRPDDGQGCPGVTPPPGGGTGGDGGAGGGGTPPPTDQTRCAGVLFQNSGDRPESFQVVSANVTFPGQPVTLQPGQSYSHLSEVPIDNLNFIVFVEDQSLDQRLEIDVACGRQQVFTFNGFGFEFEQRALPPP